MKFGYFSVLQNPDHKLPYRQLLRELEEQTHAIEEAGFHCLWLGEHHFGGEGMDIIPNPIPIASYLAARTSRIRLGLGAVIVTQWHPLRIAEDVALLDQISGGRVECGVGRGIYVREAVNLNPDADRRNEERNYALFRETVQIMRKAWTEDPFTWEGEFYKFPYPSVKDAHTWYPRNPGWRSESGEYIGMSIQPKPFQKPHPPLWNVVDSTHGFGVAAELGLKPVSWLRSRKGLAETFTAYQEAASRVQGRQLGYGEDCGLMRTAFVAPTMEEARRTTEPYIDMICNYVAGVRARAIYANPNEVLTEEDNRTPWFDFLMERDHLLIGDPNFVAERINTLQEEFNLEYLILFMTMPGLEHRHVMSSIQLFAEQVMPRVRSAELVSG